MYYSKIKDILVRTILDHEVLFAYYFQFHIMNQNQDSQRNDSGYENRNQSYKDSNEQNPFIAKGNSRNNGSKKKSGVKRGYGNGQQFKSSSSERLPFRNQQSTGTKNVNEFKQLNFSLSSISDKAFNRSVITGNFRDISNVLLPIKLSIRPDNERLIAQSSVWADKIISIQELNLRYIIGGDERIWKERLIECYVYSYYRSVLYALNDKTVAESDSPKFGLIGHIILGQCLLRPSFSFTYKESTIQFVLDIDQEDVNAVFKASREFSYIGDYINDGRRFSLENVLIERRLNSLNDSFTKDEPKMADMVNPQSMVTTCLQSDKFSLGNSFYSENQSEGTKWFYSHMTNETIFSTPMLFGKACFMVSKDDSKNSLYYESIVEDDLFYLVSREVTSICGQSYRDYLPSSDHKKGKPNGKK